MWGGLLRAWWWQGLLGSWEMLMAEGEGLSAQAAVFRGQSQGAGAAVLALLAAVGLSAAGGGSSCNVKWVHLDSQRSFQGNLCVSCEAESACSLLHMCQFCPRL